MALEFARSNILTRSAGHSAVKAAAYRAGERLIDQRIGRVADYSHRASEVGHSEILLPTGASAEMSDRTTLWAAVEAREDQHNRHASAQLAIDNIIALPVELSAEQHIEIARDFAQQEYVSRGLVVDLAIHYHSDGNPHAHLMTTTRPLVGNEFGSKDRGLGGKFYAGTKIADEVQLRHRWGDFQNAYFRKHGIDAWVRNNNGEFKAEVHLGPTHAMEKKGIQTVRQEQTSEHITAREQAILAHPSIIIDRVSDRKSLFTKHDLYRELHQLTQNPLVFANVKPLLDEHASLITFELSGKEYLTTQAILEVEMDIRMQAAKLAESAPRFLVPQPALTKVLKRYDFLSDEQRDAAFALAEGRRLGVVVGLAGTGKSVMLGALREAYEAQGCRVQGIALAGKAAEELQASAGIESRTIVSWLLALGQGRETLDSSDVVTLDEGGMVNNATMQRVLTAINQAGAKLILIGDGEQLQPIQTGCPFRDIAVQQGFTEISTIRRQRVAWQRSATKDLARGFGERALAAYKKHGYVHQSQSARDAREDLVNDYLKIDTGSKVVLAHRNVDVATLNMEIRESLVQSRQVSAGQPFRAAIGAVEEGISTPFDLRPGDDIQFTETDKSLSLVANERGTYVSFAENRHCVRKANGEELVFDNDRYGYINHHPNPEKEEVVLGAGDRVLFTQNDRQLGVKNGTLGTVESFIDGRLSVRLDGGTDVLSFGFDEYSHISYGYATTVHKSQGMTVDRSLVLGSVTMDKHLGYVALSRHRESVDVYLSADAMAGRDLGTVISQPQRQETVLDLAEKQGLELDPDHPDAFQFTHIPITQEVAMDTTNTPEGVALESASVTSPSASTAVAEANARRLLDRETRLGLAELERRHEVGLAPLTRAAETTKKDLDAHMSQQPKEKGLFGSKEKAELWRSTKRQLEIEHGNAKRAMVRAIDSFRASSGERQYIAEEHAKKKHPEAALDVARADARTQASRLLDRWRTLEHELHLVENQEHALETTQSVRESLEQVFKDLDASTLVKEALPKDRAAALANTRAENTKQLVQIRALDKSRGLGR